MCGWSRLAAVCRPSRIRHSAAWAYPYSPTRQLSSRPATCTIGKRAVSVKTNEGMRMIDFHTARLLTAWYIGVAPSGISETGRAGEDEFITTCISTDHPKKQADYLVDRRRLKVHLLLPYVPELDGPDDRSSMLPIRDNGGDEEGFHTFCSVYSRKSTENLLTYYAQTIRRPFFNIEDTNPDLTERELRKCLLWCIYYAKVNTEYKPSNSYLFSRKAYLGIWGVIDKILDILLKPIWTFL